MAPKGLHYWPRVWNRSQDSFVAAREDCPDLAADGSMFIPFPPGWVPAPPQQQPPPQPLVSKSGEVEAKVTLHDPDVDLLQYVKHTGFDSGSPLHALMHSGFIHLQPGTAGGEQRRFTIQCSRESIFIETFPHLIPPAGDPETEARVEVPRSGEDDAVYEYAPRGGGQAPRFRVELSGGPPPLIRLREQPSDGARALVVELEECRE